MKDQHTKIKGYRELSQEEIDLMNEVKQKGIELGALVSRLDRMSEAAVAAGDLPAINSESRKWVDEGKQLLQLGLMCLTRSIAKPEFF